LKLRQTLSIEQRQQKQTTYGNSLRRKRNQSCPTSAGTVGPGRVEQGISKHGVLLSFGASLKDTGIRSRGRETIAIPQK
jgi:hypothetical protein